MNQHTLGALAVFALGSLSATALGHGPVTRKADADAAEARLFTADSETGTVVAVDLPNGRIVARLATPPFILSLALSNDGKFVFAMRGRDTDRDTITVIDPGMSTASGHGRFPTIARTFVGSAPGGTHDGLLASVGGQDAIFQEGVGQIDIFGGNDFGSLSGIPVRQIKLAAPDHYFFLEAGNHLYVGHLAKSLVQILDRETGTEVGRIGNCPVLHGMGRDETTGRLFFACMKDVLVVGTKGDEADREISRIPYPTEQRIGVLIKGKNRVLWGSTEGALPALYRLNPAREPYQFDTVPVESSIQLAGTEDGSILMVYSRNGTLDIRDGGDGKLIRQVRISGPFVKEYHEHVDRAILPDILAIGDRAYISVPPEGVIGEVDIKQGKVLRRINVGGQPTRLLTVKAASESKPDESATH